MSTSTVVGLARPVLGVVTSSIDQGQWVTWSTGKATFGNPPNFWEAWHFGTL
jgi:hypothetical protein